MADSSPMEVCTGVPTEAAAATTPVAADVTPTEAGPSADDFKNQGNDLYKAQKYRESIELYSRAIELRPQTAAYYSNRSAAFIMLKSYQEALEDAQRAIALDPRFANGFLRAGKALLQLGRIEEAERQYNAVLVFDPSNATAKAELRTVLTVKRDLEFAKAALAAQRYAEAVRLTNNVLGVAADITRVKLYKVEALIGQQQYTQAQDLCSEMLGKESQNPDFLYWRGCALYYLGQLEQAIKHFRLALQADPDHKLSATLLRKARTLSQNKEAGNEAFKANRAQEAYDLYTTALEVDPSHTALNATLYNNRAAACLRLKKYAQAIEDCTKSIELDPSSAKALIRRAGAHRELQNFESAVHDFEAALRIDQSNRDVMAELRQTKLDLKKQQRKDYYKILDIPKDADERAIKKAYKKQSLIWHPDKNSHESDEKKAHAEKMFKDIQEAHSVLCDPQKRAGYDSGQDLEDIEGGGGMGGFSGFGGDASQVFQMFFGGGGGGMGGMFGGMGGMGGGRRGHHSHGHGHHHGGNPFGF